MRTDYDSTRVRDNVLREALGYVAHGVMFPFGYVPSRHRSSREKDIDTVVFVHGIAANRACFFPMQAWLSRAGLTRHLSFNYATVGSIERMAMRLRDEVDAHVRGGRVHIVAHSLGGLVARTYVQALGGERRVSTCITLGTPHRGTYSSVYGPTPMLQQLKPDGAFVRFLDALPAPTRTKFVTMGAASDHLIVPSSSSHAPFGERVPLFQGVGHTTLLLSPTVMRAVTRALPPADTRVTL
jgi:triacylglycerol lipase